MTRYRHDFDCPVAFEEQEVHETMAEVCAEHGIRQLHVAETEKYAHVTYFFNGGREERVARARRGSSSRRRGTCRATTTSPEMSARRGRRRVRPRRSRDDGYGFAVVNFANPDMVGHTGSIPAAVKAVEATDAALGQILEAVEREGGIALITADHGNAEEMLDADGQPANRSHLESRTTGRDRRRAFPCGRTGELKRSRADCNLLLGLAKPLQMSGHNLLVGEQLAGYTPPPSGCP